MPRPHLRIGISSCSIASGALKVRDALLNAGANVKTVGCNGMCFCEPIVQVQQRDGSYIAYGNITESDAKPLAKGRTRDLESKRIVLRQDTRVVLENCGEIDPLSIEDYMERGGYQPLKDPAEIIATISASGLRGRGGAGFTTGLKWSLTRKQPAEPKYVICNADEGDPGAFMDRLVLEADPHRVLDGLRTAAHAIGATHAFVYVRAEYPLAVERIRKAIEQAEKILNPLKVEVREGAGAFVCGEETALIQSLEGQRGMPKLRPPYPAEHGFRGKPTAINNVETLACVPWIMRHGAEAFAAFGEGRSRGTKVFALAGKIERGGLVETPMGITIRQIVEDIGGGIKNGRKFKAVQLGGPSGGCIPESLADTPIDYEAIAKTGAIMGSGGLVVLDDRDCMVDIARFFLKFTQAESCGKCTFCRIGTKRMLEILERICAGEGKPSDLETLETLANTVTRASLCGLGQTAPNPVLTTLRYFRDEYESHIRDKKCIAGKCTALIHYEITASCIGCTLCAQHCPVKAIEYTPYEQHKIDQSKCTKCDLCRQVCQDNAVEVL